MKAEAAKLPEELKPRDLYAEGTTPAGVDAQVLAFPETLPPRKWFFATAIAAAVALQGLSLIGYAFYEGIGVWGNNHPVFWAFDIINFVFWVGIGHAGTLISAILFLFRQRWRNSIARFAEAMTLFALTCAALFPLAHTGRPWYDFWLIPYPNQRALWVNFRSPLMWDVFAVNTYFAVSALFWYLGLIPDLASMRERTASKVRRMAYSIASLGWTGSATQWKHFEAAYLLLAGLATGLVLSVHSVVSFDFATSVVPGWHMTIFPPYFVAGAIFAGFAMVVLVLVVVRKIMNLQNLISMDHLDVMNKVILGVSCLMGYSYLMEAFTAWYSMNEYIHTTFWYYIAGPYGWAGILTISCNVVIPQVFWWKRMRRSLPAMVIVGIVVNIGMWFERFVIIVMSLQNDYIPAAWNLYRPTWVDFGILLGTFGIFFSMVLIFARTLPVIATTEVKADLPGAQAEH